MGWTQLLLQSVASDTVSIEGLVEIGDNSGADVMVSDESAIVNTLNTGVSSKGELEFIIEGTCFGTKVRSITSYTKSARVANSRGKISICELSVLGRV